MGLPGEGVSKVLKLRRELAGKAHGYLIATYAGDHWHSAANQKCSSLYQFQWLDIGAQERSQDSSDCTVGFTGNFFDNAVYSLKLVQWSLKY